MFISISRCANDMYVIYKGESAGWEPPAPSHLYGTYIAPIAPTVPTQHLQHPQHLLRAGNYLYSTYST